MNLTSDERRALSMWVSYIRKNRSYRNERFLKELYHDVGASLREIAYLADVCNTTVLDWMEKHGIERRRVGDDRVERATYATSVEGYERWDAYHASSQEQDTMMVHRLAAVAWFGFDEVKGKEVHHQNEVKWDNREENLEPMTKEEHARYHMSKMWSKLKRL